jgi:hypothetical protein
MPDGFDPHVELQKIYNLREVMIACRERVPTILNQMDSMLADPSLMPSERIRLFDMILNRAYGKPRQHVVINETNEGVQRRVQVYLPDNNRTNLSANTIDAEEEA